LCFWHVATLIFFLSLLSLIWQKTGFLAWYYTVWVGMFSAVFVGIEYGGFDALEIISQLDYYTGFDIASRISPTLGSAAVSAAINECLEPIRLVFVVSTTKPVVKMFTERF
jgi:hypothetical protein